MGRPLEQRGGYVFRCVRLAIKVPQLRLRQPHQACGEAILRVIGRLRQRSTAAWVRIDDACDASTLPLNGGVGDCTDTASGETHAGVQLLLHQGRDLVLRPGAWREGDVRLAFMTRTALKAAVDACLAAVPRQKCCSTDHWCQPT